MTPDADAKHEQPGRTYFVDEAGDAVLFSGRGKILVGSEGCSRFFLMGLLDAAEPDRLITELDELRKSLLADPYFRNVPSMSDDSRKTRFGFHAKDDLPEVRREVFQLLRRHALRIYVVVRNKTTLLDYVLQRNQVEAGYRYDPKDQYDVLVSHLFRGHLHRESAYRIVFARRYKSDRTAALRSALRQAQEQFNRKRVVRRTPEVQVVACTPPENGCLQAADYLLWAVQRLYERGEDRFFEAMREAYRLVHDLDDTRRTAGGEYYTQHRPLTAAALEREPGI